MTAADHVASLEQTFGFRAQHGTRDFDYDDTDICAVLDELKQLRDEAVELRAIRDSRVREVRAAFAAGWLEHGEIIAERIQLGHEAREKAGQSYATVRIADWSADPDQACQACGRDFGLPYVKRYLSTGRCEDCSAPQQPEHGNAEVSAADWARMEFGACADCHSPMTCAEADEPRCS